MMETIRGHDQHMKLKKKKKRIEYTNYRIHFLVEEACLLQDSTVFCTATVTCQPSFTFMEIPL